MALRKSGMMLTTAVLTITLGGAALAGDRHEYRHGDKHHADRGWKQDRKHHRGHHGKAPRNYYSGSVFVFRDRGNGTYVYGGGGGSSLIVDPLVILAPPAAPKIIDVAAESDPCSYENGVCMIRGSN